MNEKITVDEAYWSTIKEPAYMEVYPYIDEEGIWMPTSSYVCEDEMPVYRLLMSKEMFVEAYNMWIKGEQDE